MQTNRKFDCEISYLSYPSEQCTDKYWCQWKPQWTCRYWTIVRKYCPNKCGVCNEDQTTTTTTPPTTTTTSPTTTTTTQTTTSTHTTTSKSTELPFGEEWTALNGWAWFLFIQNNSIAEIAMKSCFDIQLLICYQMANWMWIFPSWKLAKIGGELGLSNFSLKKH